MKLLLEKGGANMEEQSPKGCTALIYAGRGGCANIVRYLLEHGANSLKQDNAGGTVLHHSIEKN
jgi:ankyrin repeat protein